MAFGLKRVRLLAVGLMLRDPLAQSCLYRVYFPSARALLACLGSDAYDRFAADRRNTTSANPYTGIGSTTSSTAPASGGTYGPNSTCGVVYPPATSVDTDP